MIAKLNYIVLRIWNEINSRLFWKTYIPGVRVSRWSNTPNLKADCIFFDLAHPNVHLGDRLFFLHLINSLNQAGTKILIDKEDALSHAIFSFFFGEQGTLSAGSEPTLSVITAPSISRGYAKRKSVNTVAIDFLNFPQDDLSKTLASAFGVELEHFRPTKKIEPREKVVLFSPFVNSGFFRVTKSKRQKLFDRSAELISQGHRVLLMGSKSDLGIAIHEDAFSEDLRGSLTIQEVMQYFENGQVERVICFDNFFMHLAQLYGVDCEVLFRGRFFKKNRELHINVINEALAIENSSINYISN